MTWIYAKTVIIIRGQSMTMIFRFVAELFKDTNVDENKKNLDISDFVKSAILYPPGKSLSTQLV